MLPPSWKSEVQKAVEETTAAERDQRKAEQNAASTNIVAAINSLRDAQAAQTNSEDSNDKKNQAINKATLVLVAFTVLFTGLSWWAFRNQLTEMQKVYGPINEQAETAKGQLAAFNLEAHIRLRAYLSVAIANPPPTLEVGKPRDITILVQASGQSPAIDVVGWSASGVGLFPLPESTKFQEHDVMHFTDVPTPTTLNPGNTVSLINAARADELAVDAIKIKQTHRIYVWGQMRFADVFGCKRWVNYCFSINDAVNPPRSDSCPRHNDMDQPPGDCPATFPP